MSSIESFDEANVRGDIQYMIEGSEIDNVTYSATSDGPGGVLVTVADNHGGTRRFMLSITEVTEIG
jgi:hypothetical protein